MPELFTNPTFDPHRRRRYFIDPEVQCALMRQSLVFWLWSTINFAAVLFLYQAIPAWMSGQVVFSSKVGFAIWNQMGPYLIASMTLLPIIMLSGVRFSNRIVGPMFRIRRALRELAVGKIPMKITLRNGDFWNDVAGDVNLIAEAKEKADHEANQRDQEVEVAAAPTSATADDSALAEEQALEQEARELVEETKAIANPERPQTAQEPVSL